MSLEGKSLSFRMGYVESQHEPGPERNCYLLETGAKDINEYNQGFEAGSAEREVREALDRGAR